jgi:hypothetical protein
LKPEVLDRFNDKAWLDAFGPIHSDALRVRERFHRRDSGHMEMEVRLDTELLETFCPESAQDLAHLPAKYVSAS